MNDKTRAALNVIDGLCAFREARNLPDSRLVPMLDALERGRAARELLPLPAMPLLRRPVRATLRGRA